MITVKENLVSKSASVSNGFKPFQIGDEIEFLSNWFVEVYNGIQLHFVLAKRSDSDEIKKFGYMPLLRNNEKTMQKYFEKHGTLEGLRFRVVGIETSIIEKDGHHHEIQRAIYKQIK